MNPQPEQNRSVRLAPQQAAIKLLSEQQIEAGKHYSIRMPLGGDPYVEITILPNHELNDQQFSFLGKLHGSKILDVPIVVDTGEEDVSIWQ